MKIILVSSSFYPINSPRSLRATELAKEFARQGHEVTVLTTRLEGVHQNFEQEHHLKIWDLGQPKWKTVEIKGQGVMRLLRRALRRFSSLLFEYPSIELMGMVARKLKQVQGCDLLISIAVPYPIHWGVAWAWNKNRNENPATIWIADCGDPYYGQENDSFRVPFYFGWIEKWFMRKVDWVTVPFTGAIQAYYQEFHPKIKVIPQGFSFPEIHHAKVENKIPTFAYAGNIGSYRYASIPFLKLLNKIGVDFKFIIYTKEHGFYKEHLSPETLNKCSINNYVSRNELLQDLQSVDFLIHFPYEVEIQRSLKLIDYAFLEKPILSFRNREKDMDIFIAFLEGDYRNKMIVDDTDQYRIENVALQFTSLS